MSTITQKARLRELVEGLSEKEAGLALASLPPDRPATAADVAPSHRLPHRLAVGAAKVRELRYGENPHQVAALYATSEPAAGLVGARQLQGPPMSFTNWLDADSAHGLVSRFEDPAAAIVKHTNPCGFAVAPDIARAYRSAFECDPRAAYGGVVGLNRPVDEVVARSLTETFLNVVIAPAVEPAAELRERGKLRLLIVDPPSEAELELRSIDGGLLAQSHDRLETQRSQMEVVTGRAPSEAHWCQLLTAWKLARGVKSNAIVLVRDQMAVGVGAGQMSRIEAAELAIGRAGMRADGAVAASDGPIPFQDTLEALAAAGVESVIQPGGSIREEDIAAAAERLGIALVNAPSRHFRH